MTADAISSLNYLPAAPAAKKDRRDVKAARDFEAFFLSQSFGQMFSGVGETDPMFGGGREEKIWRSFLADEYGRLFAEKGGVGIADRILSSVIKAGSD